MTDEQRYENLRAYLDQISPMEITKTASGVEIQILRHLFTPEEAESFLCLRPTPEPMEAIAERMEKPGAEVQRLLDQMVEHCLVRAVPEAGMFHYQAMPFAPGILELSVRRLDGKFSRDFEQYLAEGYGQGLARKGRPSMGRTIPVGESVVAGNKKVVAYEEIEEIISKAARPRAVQECMCRDIKERAGGQCKKHAGKETCISFGPFAQQIIDTNQGREIDDAEFRAIMAKSNEAGLIPQVVLNTTNLAEVFNVCNCCTCCCVVVGSMMKVHTGDCFEGGQAPSSYIAMVDEDNCTLCGNCFDRCQTHALVEGDSGMPAVLQGRCLGCGLCTTVCNTEAIVLERRPEQDIPVVPSSTDELFEKIYAFKKERAAAQ